MGPVVVVVLLVVMTAGTALAQVRPEPTQHARDELANAVAQGRVTLTPTPTMTSTLRPVPAPTQAPVATPTLVVVEDLVAPPLLPALPLPDAAAGPQPVYLLPVPTTRDWLVLATVFGRWGVRLGSCDPLPLVSDLLIDPLPPDGVPELETLDGTARCQMVQWMYVSPDPCFQDADGACSAQLDPEYVPPAPEPVVIVQTVVSATATLPPPTRESAPRPAASVPAQVVVVTATPVPPTATVPPTSPPQPTATLVSTRAPTATPTLKPTATAVAVVQDNNNDEAVVIAEDQGTAAEPEPREPIVPRWPTFEVLGLWLGAKRVAEVQPYRAAA